MNFDQTDDVLNQANKVGEELGLRKEIEGFRLISGVDHPYNYNGASYNTYLTSGNWINDHVCILQDWTDINLVNELFGRNKPVEEKDRARDPNVVPAGGPAPRDTDTRGARP